MTIPRTQSAGNQLPSPFPEGWYFVATRAGIEREGLLRKLWMGESIIAWSDDRGHICVAESHCPHLGSDMGPEAGGRVCEGRLVCPFHGYAYDAAGWCVDTPYADPPRNTRLQVFETAEINGLIFAWWGIDGRPPQWELHPDRPETEGWCGPAIRTFRFAGHPQEATENSVDLAHFRYVHGYGNFDRVGRISVDGARLESCFNFRSVRKVAGLTVHTVDVSAVTHVFGLGYSFVKIREHAVGADLRLWVLATPVDGTLIDLTLVSQAREIRNPKRRIVGLGFLPVSWRAPIFNRFMAAQQKSDVLQDVAIWSRKQYRARPRLCRSDGEIMPFRAYCAQFYPRARDDAGAPSESSQRSLP